MNKIGITNFWTNLQQLQEIEDCQVPVTTQLTIPVSKHVKVLSKLMNNWILFVGICFSAVTLKILAEWLVERMR